jgi:hypothetical protein
MVPDIKHKPDSIVRIFDVLGMKSPNPTVVMVMNHVYTDCTKVKLSTKCEVTAERNR